MTSPYKKRLAEHLKSEVTVDRAGAASVTGTVMEIEDDACLIKESIDGEETARFY